MNLNRPLVSIAVVLVVLVLAACQNIPTSLAPSNTTSRVYFIQPQDGATVVSPVQLKFGAAYFKIEPVGDGEVHEGAGHLHLTVGAGCVESGKAITKAAPHIHFADRSKEIELELDAGTHRLCLQAADGEHTALAGEGMMEQISISVK